jgi:hypothetical protein
LSRANCYAPIEHPSYISQAETGVNRYNQQPVRTPVTALACLSQPDSFANQVIDKLQEGPAKETKSKRPTKKRGGEPVKGDKRHSRSKIEAGSQSKLWLFQTKAWTPIF